MKESTMQRYRINVVGNAPYGYSTESLFGLLFCNNGDILEIPQNYPFEGEWGQPSEIQILNNDEFPLPSKIDIVWLSIAEKKFYDLVTDLPTSEYEVLWNILSSEVKKPIYNSIVVGMSPGGYISIWFWGQQKSINVGWFKARETTVPMEQFIPNHPDLTVDSYCELYMGSIDNNLDYSVLSFSFTKKMIKYSSRYQIIFEKWDNDEEKWEKYEENDDMIPKFEYIEESLYDGTHDKLHDGGLLRYHEAGKPKKLAVKWHIKKSEYTAFFWFDETLICEIFEKFYGVHRDTKADFIIRIDAEQKKYELALYRYGLKEPMIISEDTYQLLVFKNKFEHHRSDNYNQERGAWIW